MMMKINIVSSEFVKPSSPTPSHLRDFKLSYLDQLIPPSYVPLILYYSYSTETSNVVTQLDMARSLKESLSETLTKFYPLAGRMTTKDQSSVDCSDQGAYYLEVRVDSQLSEIIQAPEIEMLDRFLPHTLNAGVNGMVVRVEEQLAVQVNMFQCGGIAIGICVNHRLADICTIGSFIKAWAAATTSRGDNMISSSSVLPPVFESTSLFPPATIPNSTVQTVLAAERNIVSKRFVFTASAIAALKAKVVSSTCCAINPTRVEVVSALLWKCGILLKTGLNKPEKTSVALQVVNLRGRMVPPLKEHSFGNIFQMARAIITEGRDQTELGCLVAKFRAAIGEIDNEYIQKLLGENGFEIAKSKFAEIGNMMYEGDVDQLFTVTSWCRFPNIYEADFGWGKASWVSRASTAGKNCVYLMDSTKNEGGIEAWVVMSGQDMADFEQLPQLQTLLSTFPCS